MLFAEVVTMSSPLVLERLEGRALLATNITATLSGGILTVEGTDTADLIDINYHSNSSGRFVEVLGRAIAPDGTSQPLTKTYGLAEIQRIVVRAGKGADQVMLGDLPWSGEPTSLWGGDGNDTIYGSDSTDTISALKDRDMIWGDAGNDLLVGEAGADTVYGGIGNDSLYGEQGYDRLIGNDGDDRLFSGSNDWNERGYLDGGIGRDSLWGNGGPDTMIGGTENDFLSGANGADSMLGGAGNDSLDGGYGNDTMCGEQGNDTLYGGHNADSMYGGDQPDYLDGYSGRDTLVGGEGNDTLQGNADADTLRGSIGNDFLMGGSHNDSVLGEDGRDTLMGQDGNDTLRGGNHNDQLSGGLGNDELYGDAGNDTLWGDSGTDYLNGGMSNDTLFGTTGSIAEQDTFRRNLSRSGLANPYGRDYGPWGPNGAYMVEPAPSLDYYTQVIQRQSPTCGFLASLAAVSTRTTSVNDLIVRVRYDAASDRYGIRLSNGVAFREILVNGDWNGYYDPREPIWVTLYQKAYLALMGVNYVAPGSRNYLAASAWIQPGVVGPSFENPGIALRALTGRAIEAYGNAPGSRGGLLATEMRTALQTGYAIVAGTMTQANLASNRFVGSHAYAVLSVDYSSTTKQYYVKLYNPHGEVLNVSFDTFVRDFYYYYRAKV